MTFPSNEELLPWPARALVCAAFACGSATAAVPSDAQVYRCGDSYSSQPCGNATPLDFSDPRSADERAQGQDVARRERRLADTLAAERKARDAPSPAVVARTKPACAASAAGRCTTRSPRPRHARPGDATASRPLVVKVPANSKAAAR